MGEIMEARKRILEQKSFAFKQTLSNIEELIHIYQAEKSRREEMEAVAQRTRIIIDSISDGVLATNAQLEIIDANPVICHLLERKHDEIVGKSLAEIPQLRDVLAGLQTRLGEGNPICEFEVMLTTPLERALHISAARISCDEGFVCVIHDVTAQKRAENLKYEFLSILSHELKTPLTGIIGFAELLNVKVGRHLSPQESEYLNTILQFGQQMHNVVNELLQFAQLQSVGLDSQSDLILLDSVFEQVFQNLAELCENKNIRIEFENQSNDAWVMGSASMLLQAFQHIVQNAVVFGNRDGNVWIKIMATGPTFEIRIADNGVGIPAAEIERVFNSFYQVQEHMHRNQDGLGLGLSIARHVIEFHKGKILLESKLGEGTTCIITLPAAGK